MPALALITNETNPPPWTGTFNLTLSRTQEGLCPDFLPIDVQFTYTWDFPRNMGQATVLSIGSNHTVNQDMFPIGISGALAFMARDQFPVTIEGPKGREEIFAYRVLLNMDKSTLEHKKAAIMLGTEGNTIITTENWGATELL
ncbi:hypothetical protein Dda_7253 [Drechslerella dactyloides]|uniref:Uncharacterized protein n=1 Tax=Drechslerella dactyloides TaxID=74499 RepID=A0AAD6NI62_DREDA|nr:hypothetical protein Dda_7253 [Drechslerella dactyloides]